MAVHEGLTPVPDLSDLPPMDRAARMERLRTAIDGSGCDALVVSDLTNVRYLTGFTGSAALLLVGARDAVFVTDGRYREQSVAELGAAGVDAEVEVVASNPDAAVAEAAKARAVGRLGLESDVVTWAAQRRWESELFEGELVPTTGVVGGLRLVKDDAEAARILAACDIADRALASVRHRLAERPTESEFARDLDTAMRDLGAADVSFETIVASGPNGARPHHRPGGRTIVDGDLVVVDFGALVDGYHSDMTRTVAVGDVGAERLRMLEVVLASQAAGVEAVAAGATAAEVDRACREVIDDAGWGDAFVHSTGHGVGLDIHEEPRVSSRSESTLVAGHVVTVEPGVYLPGLGGVRIEDTLLVADGGCERLTRAPKEPSLA